MKYYLLIVFGLLLSSVSFADFAKGDDPNLGDFKDAAPVSGVVAQGAWNCPECAAKAAAIRLGDNTSGRPQSSGDSQAPAGADSSGKTK